MCKGHCATGTCTWNAHTSTAAAAYLSLDVDASNVIHVATTEQFVLYYSRVSGAGPPTTEMVSLAANCFQSGGPGANSLETLPVTAADGSGKARIVCTNGDGVLAYAWNGTAWNFSSIYRGSGGDAGILYSLGGSGNRIAFVDSVLSADDVVYFGEVTGTAWMVRQVAMQDAAVAALVGGPDGAAQIAWQASPSSTSILVATQSGAGFGAPVTVPAAGAAYALDGGGHLVGVDPSLAFHVYSGGPGGTWTSEPIATATGVTALDMVIDATGAARVAWADAAGVHLATRLGPSSWSVEKVSSTTAARLDLAVGPTGKVAVGVTSATGTGFTVFE
jgi:hypothetical protein